GTQGSRDSGGASLSADGRFVAFTSFAPNLVDGDSNDTFDVFVRDRCLANGVPVSGCTPSTSMESVNAAGDPPVGCAVSPGVTSCGSSGGVISPNGRFVAFTSVSPDLVAGDTNGRDDVFVRDRCLADGVPVSGCTPHTELASATPGGTPGNDESSWASM